VIAMSWDSTTNAQFDKRCLINVATPMTPSERACAASHVMTWKLIYELFANKSMDPSSELAKFLSAPSASSGILQHKYTDNSQSGGSRKSSFKPLPTPYVYDLIPEVWMSAPRPQHQKTLIGEEERLAEVNNMCNLLALGHQSSNFEYQGKFFLILEDDAVINPHPKLKGKHVHPNAKKLIKKDFLQRMKEIEEKIPSDFDICYLGYTGKTFKKSVKKVLVRPQYVWQLHAYLLSPKGAAKLLMQLPVSAPVDNFIAKLIFENKLEVINYRFVRVLLSFFSHTGIYTAACYLLLAMSYTTHCIDFEV
jgi:GR25 family glycosyltransferase involved in LPS biosynthesis